jgi:hypothetical protein
MLSQKRLLACLAVIAMGVLVFLTSVPALAQNTVINEDFATVVGPGTGTGVFFDSSTGLEGHTPGWDAGIEGEEAFAGYWGTVNTVGTVAAYGDPTGGVFSDGSGELTVSGFDVPDANNGGWWAGLMWPGLQVPTSSPAMLELWADVRGNIPGGKYQLRLEANRYSDFGLDEGFETVIGPGTTAGVHFFAPGDYDSYQLGWDDGIDGEEAFAGMTAACTMDLDGGAWALGVQSGGLSGGGGGQITVKGITVPDLANRWWGGLAWSGQLLPSTDLSQVELYADIKGTTNTAGENLGDFMIRIEDQDRDYLGFRATADGGWNRVGGYLNALDVIEGGDADWLPSDDDFDETRGPFKVVVVFYNDGAATPAETWGSGGTLTVDNLFLTGGTRSQAIGSFFFAGTADGSYQSIGGSLDSATSTFENVDEDFNTVVGPGTGDGTFYIPANGGNGWTPGWDLGIDGEAAFAGYWGDVTFSGSGRAYGTVSGGANGTGAGELVLSGLTVNGECGVAGGWWGGLVWEEQWLPPGDLEDIYLTAKIKGQAGASGFVGRYHLRIEDAEGDWLGFNAVAPSIFHEAFIAGGALGGEDSDVEEGTFIGDGTFHRDHGPFKVIVAFFQECETWGTGGTLTVDDLSLTSPTFVDADDYSVIVAFDDEAGSWGPGGTLTVDRLQMTSPIPTMSEWGVIAMVLLLLSAGTVLYSRRRTAAARVEHQEGQ